MKMMVPMTAMLFWKRKLLSLRLHHWWLQYTHVAMSDEQVRTSVKDNEESNVLFMWRKKRMKANEWQCFSFGCFHFLFL